MKKLAGRPKSFDGKDIINLDECVLRATALLGQQPWCKRTLRNKISKGELERFGTYRIPMVDWNEVRRTLNWRRKTKADAKAG